MKYHYSFPAKFFKDYHWSLNKDVFLKIEQPKNEYPDLGSRINKEGGCNDNAGSDISNYGGLVQGVWTKGALKEYNDPFGKEVLDEDVPNDNHKVLN